ncbi:YjcQ family protein [Lysinibacillus fusiformis]|uniref:YjcQ family protein n=1 Tax=Lysinibacillus fusiformis TaxID=28031 RepID=UPI002D76C9BB|nr:YjcQ family protein [Lysinibacillus fusiformis]WRS99238.1 YjcQ family protein [Lysinibacillus fusiformis]
MDKKFILNILDGIFNAEEPKFYDFDIDKETFGEIVEVIQNEGLISGAKISRVGLDNRVAVVSLHHAELELKGLNYISNMQDTQISECLRF